MRFLSRIVNATNLQNKHAELKALAVQLAQRERDLATARAELAAFEADLVGAVGALFAELDEVRAQLAEADARERPHDVYSQRAAAAARAEADASRHALAVAALPVADSPAIAGQSEIALEWVPGKDVAAEVDRTVRTIAQVRRRLAAIDTEMSKLANSAPQRLRQHIATARGDSRDLVAEIANRVTRQIALARSIRPSHEVTT